ncbi:SsgA family sporulation/cell division regulator [Streptomyces alkaliterrae]|uniref:SsgA family sporulation/cell division regulator n=1 Tax=Streptomyces alkaliterrae TaxID=2213162 RepID=A0A5P0YZP1_9ACTN|nr:SsgA family sporulation/cell division regulator [Streptomyces alkaliterrae]MBB1255708.1 SsgA family sporulation/cell division regulator [Streptomyces alkaliterrae]MBB1261400.1 SsgA family sporulation/cell division regulator [Streptomyces alkaliterrae]MQS04149.1 SsgA family sporulation/cell division regulator [Streptomyces alkaliterrae]
METVIEREMELRLVVTRDRSVGLPARFTYRTGDPYAVHVSFHIDTPQPVHWTFARELLVEGVFRPCGHGDVRVWPTKVKGRNVICLALNSPDGEALVEAPSVPLAAWLERTLRVLAPGDEASELGIDEGLAALLAPAGGGEDPFPFDGRPTDEPGEPGA